MHVLVISPLYLQGPAGSLHLYWNENSMLIPVHINFPAESEFNTMVDFRNTVQKVIMILLPYSPVTLYRIAIGAE